MKELLILLVFLFLLFITFKKCKCNERYLIPSNQLPKDLMYIHN